ncbi:DUF1329 domain-containing protein [Acidocella sp.]|uniref:DUF1329 domain-containing protein n=1 Tax=Acidocella sp. TaxID=50710 RepID=UPI002634370F|nr:DUF1329 domain-containing protein [Acidocella sp.]
MKRRDFGLLAASSLATATVVRTAQAQSAPPDTTLLTTTLTPMGAERAGNADGSIPAWTGGVTAPPPPPGQPIAVHMFEDEQPLYTVNADNMHQYAELLSEGIKVQIQKWGLALNVYKTHRTAAAPQYVYDNTAKNVTRAKLDPRGGRFGFTGAVGGAPFPIIDTADPLVGGAQLIWNKLTGWYCYENHSICNPGCVVIDGKVVLVALTKGYFIYPYYAPDVTPENYEGYYSKLHVYDIAPGSVVGQEVLVWQTTNVNVHPDIVWTLLNGQGRVRKAPNEAYDSPNPESNGIDNQDEAQGGFYGNPSQYNWTFIAKKEMLIPYNSNKLQFGDAAQFLGPHAPNPDILRWEKHRVWVVEGNLAPGVRNVNVKRRLYLDEDTWNGSVGESYDAQGNMVKAYTLYCGCVPAFPGHVELCEMTLNLMTGDYVFNGNCGYGSFTENFYLANPPPSVFEPQEMAANASF